MGSGDLFVIAPFQLQNIRSIIIVVSNLENLQAYKYNKKYPQNLFLFYGWYIDKWWVGTEEDQENLKKLYPDCTSEQIASVVPYSLAPLQAEFLMDLNESTVISSGIVSFY